MNCDDLKAWFAESPGTEMPADVRRHLSACEHCRRMVAVLRSAHDAPEYSNPELFDSIEQKLTARMDPVRPFSIGRMRATLAAALVVVAGIGVWSFGPGALRVLQTYQLAAVLITLAAVTAWLTCSVVTQAVPGSRYRLSPLLTVLTPAALLAAVFAALFDHHEQEHFLLRAWICFRAGVPFGLTVGVASWLVLRRGCVLVPRLTGATAGLLSGLAGTAMLSMHCPNLNAWHILLGHLGVSIAGAVVGYVVGEIAERSA